MPFIKIGDSWAHINVGRQPRRKCGFCRERWADLLCDFPTPKGKTCDRPICNKCATSGGENVDYCPDHASASPQATLF